MTNKNIDIYLPAAPRARGISSLFNSLWSTMRPTFDIRHSTTRSSSAFERHSAVCILHSALVAVALAAGMASAAEIAQITSAGGVKAYTAAAGNNAIEFQVALIDDVASVAGNPYLVLSGIQNADGSEARATYASFTPEGVKFSYAVRPGDYSAGVGIASFQLNGATIEMDSEGAFTDTTLPSEDRVLNGETITISTITFAANGTTAYSVEGYKGSAIDVEISLGGPATAAQSFTVASSDTTKAQPTSATVTIPQNQSSGTVTINLLDKTPTSTPAEITIHPNGYTGTAGDLTVSATVKAVSATVETAPPFYAGNDISVKLALDGVEADDFVFEVSSSDATKAKPASGSETMTIAAGDLNATATINLLAATGTGDPVTLTFHPQGVTGTAGDVTLSISINEAAEPAIVAVRPYNTDNGKYTAGLIQIEVELSGAITQVGTANPTLKLAMDPGGRTATLDGEISEYVGETSLFFTYTIQPGDAVADLDCEAGTRPRGLQIGGRTLSANAWSAMPKKGAVGSLGANADIQIETIRLGSNNERTATLNGREGDPLSVVVTRASEDGISPTKALGFTITPSEAGKVDFEDFSIPVGENEAMLTLNLVEKTTDPLTLTLHPNGYASTAGDIVLTIDITEGSKPAVLITGPAQLEEGSGISEISVTLARPPKEQTTVTLSCDNPANLAILSATTLTFAAGDNTPKPVTVQPLDGGKIVNIAATPSGSSYSPGTHSLYIVNRDPILSSPPAEGWEPPQGGEGFSYTIGWSGTDVDADMADLYAIVHWGDGTTERYDGAQGSASHIYTAAGSFGITVELHDQDGGVASASGLVTIEAAVSVVINEYKVRLATDRSQNTYKGLQGLGRGTIDDNLEATTRRGVDHRYPNDVQVNFEIKYAPTQANAAFTATPERFDYPSMDDEGQIVYTTYDSFFHVWMGAGGGEPLPDNALIPIAPDAVNVTIMGTPRTIGGVFAREYYAEDGCADIDADGLPDLWEQLYFGGAATEDGESAYPFESIVGDFGPNANPDDDWLPRGAVKDEHVVYPLANYVPNGLAYNNLLEARGFHHGLNMRKEATAVIGTTNLETYVTLVFPEGANPDADTPTSVTTNTVYLDKLPAALSGAAVGDRVGPETKDGADTYLLWLEEAEEPLYQAETSLPIDEPHKGKIVNGAIIETDALRNFYGTDPTDPDSDGDGLLDGWEYYWWRVAEEAKAGTLDKYDDTFFRKYNPQNPVLDGDVISPDQIILVCHPLVPTSGDKNLVDLDGDGLLNAEEMLLGTNPFHWDTDKDGMNDGWETMWGLDPLANDGAGNPDGDYMAAYGPDSDHIQYRHAEVYKVFGFDPRTAWIWQYKERNRKLAPSDPYSYAPNTMPYSNFEEYYLGQWCIEKGIAFSVEPLSRRYFTQPVPAGTLSYVTISGEKVSLNKRTYSAGGEGDGGTNTVDTSLGTIQIPPNTLVYKAEIKTHGCDSDGDGMPDGWELYVSSGDQDYIITALWPISPDGTSALDAIGDPDGEGLSNLRECHSTELCEYYVGVYSNFTANANGNWYNKWWPSDPWNPDTDYDGLDDMSEACEGPNAPNFRYAQTRTVEELEERYGGNTLARGHVPGGGLNPNAVDTDMDYLPDFWEYQHGGFNRDTDWEGGFCDQPGTYSRWVNPTLIEYYGGGMDGTYFDSRNGYDEFEGKLVTVETARTNKTHFIEQGGYAIRDFDYDHDGLENYQEYWINGMYHFQYDKWQEGLDYGDYDVQAIFATGPFARAKRLGVYWKPVPGGYAGYDMLPGSWTYDWSRYTENWQEEGAGGPTLNLAGEPAYPFWYMPPEVRPRPIGPLAYASADPRLADTDGDNMDDFFEMFHALNPILSDHADICNQPGERPPDVYDFNKCPWLAGMPHADPDQDGLPNWEEAISPNEPDPANYNTDPSPVWFTDISYPRSFVNLYYNFGSVANYWAPEGRNVYELYPDPYVMWPGLAGDPRPNYLFSFEINEGFDTDNDNLSDRYEIFGTSGGVTDAQDGDRPIGRKALYLDGDAAARTRGLCAFGKNALRSWTIEAWVCPEEPAAGRRQVILERPCAWLDGDSTPTYESVRRTFRLGLEANGVPFVEYNNGGKDFITECAAAPEGLALPAGQWTHLAASFDGYKMKLKLYIDGRLVAAKPTSAIPYTGFTYSGVGTVNGSYSNPLWAPIVLGASDSNPEGKVDGGFFYDNGSIGKILGGQPALADFYKGWIDEVRVWTGVRPGGEDADARVKKWHWRTIKDDRDSFRRYGAEQVLESRNTTIRDFGRMVSVRKEAVEAGKPDGLAGDEITWYLVGEGLTFDEYYQAATEYITMTGGEDDDIRIPPMLLCCYNFDNLPDPDYESAVPAKFAALNGRPVDYAGAPWWRQAYDRTTVYKGAADAPYCFQHYIENVVATLPLGYLHNVPGEYDTEYAAIQGNEVEIPVYRFRHDHVVNSKFWTRFTKAGTPLVDLVEYGDVGADYENNFPNKANPYGLHYITSNFRSTESHPTLMLLESFDPVHATMYNHLLPLRNARADMAVGLWDDIDGSYVGVNIDTDGDGLPDFWEQRVGLDPYNADENGNGVPDYYDDFDSDGLSNYAEWKAGTDPYDATTGADGVLDYEALYTDPETGLTFLTGVFFTDNDYVNDSWESQWDGQYASTFRYDEHYDQDGDGWDNWSEALCDYRADGTGGSLLGTIEAVDITPTGEVVGYSERKPYPMPTLDVELDFDKSVTHLIKYETKAVNDAAEIAKWQNIPNCYLTEPKYDEQDRIFQATVHIPYIQLVVHGYASADMNGTPDVVYAKKVLFTGIDWPIRTTLKHEDVRYGHVRQGLNWFFAFVDTDDSKLAAVTGTDWFTWTPGEPAAVMDGFETGYDIGFDRNELRFALRDKPVSYARLAWAEDGKSHIVHVNDSLNNTVFEMTVQPPRTWIHEGDIIRYALRRGQTSNFGLGAQAGRQGGGTSPNLLKWYVDNVQMGVISNYYSATLPTPRAIYPVNDALYEVRPLFQFSLAPEATEFLFELRRGSASGTVVYSGRHLAPGRYMSASDSSAFDLCKWRFPYCVGDTMPNGTVFLATNKYYWTVTAYSPADRTGKKSAAADFFAAMSDLPSNMGNGNGDKGLLFVNLRYPGMAAFTDGEKPKIRVQAFRSQSFNGLPDAEVTVMTTGLVTIAGLDIKETRFVWSDAAMAFVSVTDNVKYYIRAFVDQNGDYRRASWESWGYYRDEGNSAAPFRMLPLTCSALGNTPTVNVTIRDADTDNDFLPDCYEYIKAGKPSTASSAWLPTLGYGSSRYSAKLSFASLSALPLADFDGDGLSDVFEFLAASDPVSADTDGDGISDGLERRLGFDASTPQTLKITSITFDADGDPVVDWTWDGAASAASAGASGRAGQATAPATLASEVVYELQGKADLADAEWTTVRTVRTNLVDGEAAVSAEEAPAGLDVSAFRFFRVKVRGDAQQ
ncbi:MAG: hypothetical protein IJQ73_10770 [Kiritimatiellae bacterium]|nr:hypothetical protein [Kiritimatiellia bacterium]